MSILNFFNKFLCVHGGHCTSDDNLSGMPMYTLLWYQDQNTVALKRPSAAASSVLKPCKVYSARLARAEVLFSIL